MAFICPNLVQETTTTTGTGPVTLLGAVTGALDFDSQLANADTVQYAIVNSDTSEYEVGIGTFSTSGPTITRTTILFSSNGGLGGSAESFTAGTKNVIGGLAGSMIGSLIDPDGTTGVVARTAANTYARRTLTAGAGHAITNGDGVSGNPVINTNIVDVTNATYGAVGDGSTDDTQAIQDAVDAGPNIKVYFPKGIYKITSTITISEMSVYLYGDGGLASELRFVPTGADVMFHVQAPASAVYYRGGMKDLFFSSNDFSYVKTGILLEDISEYRLHGLTCHDSVFGTGWSDTSTKSSIFLHTTGRDTLSVRDCQFTADLPLLIDQNPNTLRTQVLDADHFNFHNMYLLCTVNTAMPCVRVTNGVNFSDLSFTGYQPWVRPGGNGFELIDTTNNSIASLNLIFDGVGFEQAQGTPGTDFSFRIDKTGTNNINGINFRNFGCAVEINGFYLRGCDRINFDQGYVVGTYSGQVVLNANGTCDDLDSRNVDWQGNDSDAVATTTGLVQTSGDKKLAVASPLPENFHMVAAQTDDEDQQGVREFDGQNITRKITLADDGTYNVGSVGTAELAMVQIVAKGSTVRESAVFSSDSYATTKLAGTSGTAITAASGFLSFYRGSDGGGSIDILKNETGESLTVLIIVRKTLYDTYM